MDVLVAGGHGKVALRLLGLLAARGDRARGLIRNPDHAADLEEAGAEPVLFDLEAGGAPIEQVAGADAVVFAAGAGPGSGPERKRTVDLGGALQLIAACKAAGVDRYVMVSAIGVRSPGEHSGPMEPYLDAKAEADAALRESGLAYTIVRPGSLTDDPGSGHVEATLAPSDKRGAISRDDVAATLVATLDEPRTVGLSFDLIAGDTTITEAIAGLLSGEPGGE